MTEVLERRASPGLLPPLDYRQLREGLGSDPELLRELIPIYADDARLCVARFAAAIPAGDAREIRAVGHLLAGASSAFAAAEVTALARRLEHMGTTGNLTGADEAFAELEDALTRVGPLLELYGAEMQALVDTVLN